MHVEEQALWSAEAPGSAGAGCLRFGWAKLVRPRSIGEPAEPFYSRLKAEEIYAKKV